MWPPRAAAQFTSCADLPSVRGLASVPMVFRCNGQHAEDRTKGPSLNSAAFQTGSQPARFRNSCDRCATSRPYWTSVLPGISCAGLTNDCEPKNLEETCQDRREDRKHPLVVKTILPSRLGIEAVLKKPALAIVMTINGVDLETNNIKVDLRGVTGGRKDGANHPRRLDIGGITNKDVITVKGGAMGPITPGNSVMAKVADTKGPAESDGRTGLKGIRNPIASRGEETGDKAAGTETIGTAKLRLDTDAKAPATVPRNMAGVWKRTSVMTPPATPIEVPARTGPAARFRAVVVVSNADIRAEGHRGRSPGEVLRDISDLTSESRRTSTKG